MLKLVENNAGPGGGVEEFQWSTSEQVWPFEKTADGKTLYCKEVDFGALPNNGTKNVNHGISLSSNNQLWHLTMLGTGDVGLPIPFVVSGANNTNQVQAYTSTTQLTTYSGANHSMRTARFRLWYIKD